MKHYTRLFLVIFSQVLVFITNAQETSSDIELTLARIKAAADAPSLSITVVYEHLLKKSVDFQEFDSCKVFRRGNRQYTVSKGLDTFHDSQFYVKIDRRKQLIYVIQDTDSLSILGEAKINSPLKLDFEGLIIDSLLSKPQEAYLIFNNKEVKEISSVELTYSPVSYLLNTYQINYNKENESPYLGMRLKIKKIENESTVPTKEDFFTLKNGEIYLAAAYQKLRLVTNLKIPK